MTRASGDPGTVSSLLLAATALRVVLRGAWLDAAGEGARERRRRSCLAARLGTTPAAADAALRAAPVLERARPG